MERLIAFAIRRYVGGPGRSWLFTGLALASYRKLRSTTGRRQLIDIGEIAKGQKIVIEHLPETHAHQLKMEKREGRATRSANRAATRKRLTAAARRARHRPSP